MHGNQDAGLEIHQEIVGAGIMHPALTGIHGKERNVNDGLFLNEGLKTAVKVPLGGFDFHDGRFIPPVPEIEVSGMEQGDAGNGNQKGNALIG